MIWEDSKVRLVRVLSPVSASKAVKLNIGAASATSESG